jgi:RHS repeat-associated protein
MKLHLRSLIFVFYFLYPFQSTFSQIIIPGDTSGFTVGNFSVTDGGAAVYGIPIIVSPGTAGMQPSLSVAYSSQGGNGIMGLGWSLQGISTIGRYAKTLAQDSEIREVRIDQDDKYGLDGERLVIDSGTYGAPGSIYRTEQNAFNKIVSYGPNVNGSPLYYKVWTNSGLIMEYGSTSDSRIEAQGASDILYWCVSKITDTKGNYMSFSYFEDNATGEYRPTRIDYTGNAATGLLPYASVQFFYSPRPDTNVKYVSGHALRSSQILTSVQCFFGTDIVRTYLFNYDYSSFVPRLQSLTECGTDGICFKPTIFTYSNEDSLAFSRTPTTCVPSSFLAGTYTQLISGDWNADGLQDLLIYNPGDGTNNFYQNDGQQQFPLLNDNPITTSLIDTGQLIVSDFDADGFSDVLYYDRASGTTRFYLNNHTGSFFTNTSNIPTSSVDGGSFLRTGDWNGDGRTDLMWLDSINGDNNWFLNNGVIGLNISFSSIINPVSFGANTNPSAYFFGDWNSDGMNDLMYWNRSTGTNTWYELHGTNSTLQFTTISNAIDPSQIISGASTTNLYLGEWNGDGSTDVMLFDKSTGGNKFYFSKGNLLTGFDGPLQNRIDNSIPNYYNVNEDFYIVDYNGDGFSDILIVNFDGSSGDHLWYKNDGLANFGPPIQNPPGLGTDTLQNKSILFGNFSGTGVMDIVWYERGLNTNNNFLWVNHIERANLLSTIQNGHNAHVSIEYLPLHDNTVYVKEDNAVYPEYDFNGSFFVVSAYNVDNGVGGQNRVSYKYEGAKMDLQGRGFRGFKNITSTDERSGMVARKFFDRDYRYLSSPLVRTETRLLDGTLLNETDFTNAFKSFYFFSYTYQTIAKSYELDGSLIMQTITTTDFDDYGNPLYTTVDYGSGYVDSTYNQYQNNPYSWVLGRLTRSTVYRIAPNHPPLIRNSEFEYDPISHLITKEITEPDSGINLKMEKAYAYDSYGNIISSTTTAWNGSSIENRTDSSIYDNKGRFITTSINALGHQTMKSYDQKLGHLISTVDPNNLTTTFEYDGFGREIKVTDATGNWIKKDYRLCPGGNCPVNGVYFVVNQTAATPPFTDFYDLNDRVIRTEKTGFDGTLIFEDKVYDSKGKILSVSDPYFQSGTAVFATFQYDTVGRTVVQTLPGNRTSTMVYQGLQVTETNPIGQTNVTIKDPLERMIVSTDAQSNSVHYSYNGAGNNDTIRDPLGNTIISKYDVKGNKVELFDPDLGTLTYAYNAFNELISMTDALGNVTTYKYDKLGRLIERTETEGVTNWTYDSQLKGIGKLGSITSYNGYAYTVEYDAFSRIGKEIQIIDGISYSDSLTYDSLNRLDKYFYPSGFSVRNEYNVNGYLTKVRRTSDNFIYWEANQVNARGQIESHEYGNGVLTTSTFDPNTGFLSQTMSNGPGGNIQNLTYSFDAISKLQQRQNLLRGLQEDFQYDNLNRLTQSIVQGVDTLIMSYDILGNLTSKSDLGTYSYGAVNNGPHRVTSITMNAGECIPSLTVNTQHTSFHKVKQVDQDSLTLEIFYGPSRQRNIQNLLVSGNLAKKKIYFGNTYEKITDSTNTKELHYIRANGLVVAVYSSSSSGNKTEYWHRDHLGSLQSVTDSTGALVDELSYDAWGNRRTPDWSQSSDTIYHFERGFTGHEHYDLFDLVDMNGRMYDPVLARFLSPDPNIQAPSNLQSLNRYSYVFNNPLSITDPSGYWGFSLGFISIGNDGSGFGVSLNTNPLDWNPVSIALNNLKEVNRLGQKTFGDTWNTIVQVGVTIAVGSVTGGIGGPLVGAMVSGAATGFAGNAVAVLAGGGSLGDALKAGAKGAAIGVVTSAATFGVGSLAAEAGKTGSFGNLGVKTAGHGVVQGGATALQGGKFEHGLFAGAISGGTEDLIGSSIKNKTAQVVSASVVGGTTSEIGGGKFVNGAVSGAFVMMYNRQGHEDNSKELWNREDDFVDNYGEDIIEYTGEAIGATEEQIDRSVSLFEKLKNTTNYGTESFWISVGETLEYLNPDQANQLRLNLNDEYRGKSFYIHE